MIAIERTDLAISVVERLQNGRDERHVGLPRRG